MHLPPPSQKSPSGPLSVTFGNLWKPLVTFRSLSFFRATPHGSTPMNRRPMHGTSDHSPNLGPSTINSHTINHSCLSTIPGSLQVIPGEYHQFQPRKISAQHRGWQPAHGAIIPCAILRSDFTAEGKCSQMYPFTKTRRKPTFTCRPSAPGHESNRARPSSFLLVLVLELRIWT